MMHRGPGLLFCLFAAAATFAHGSVALFMEEPYGDFGAVNPTGHSAVYFNHICADSPTSLRPCHDGEYGDQRACVDAQSAYRPAPSPCSALISVSSVEQRFVILDTKARFYA